MKYIIEVRNEDVAEVLDLTRFWHVEKVTTLEPVYGQYCTTVIEIVTSKDIMQEIYSDMKVMKIRNYRREAA